jgi:hypothetical protein
MNVPPLIRLPGDAPADPVLRWLKRERRRQNIALAAQLVGYAIVIAMALLWRHCQ